MTLVLVHEKVMMLIWIMYFEIVVLGATSSFSFFFPFLCTYYTESLYRTFYMFDESHTCIHMCTSWAVKNNVQMKFITNEKEVS